MKDPYIQPNGTLKNKLGITEPEELRKAERDIAFAKLIDVDEINIGEINMQALKKIHTHLFQDIYEWAGEFRTIPIEKIEEVVIPGISIVYASPQEIDKKLDKVLTQMNAYDFKNKNLNEFSTQFTKYLAQIWRIHPFREGNTRTILTFANMFAKSKEFDMDMSVILDELYRKYDKNGRAIQYCVRDKFLLASLDEEYGPEYEPLKRLFEKAIKSANKKNFQNNITSER